MMNTHIESQPRPRFPVLLGVLALAASLFGHSPSSAAADHLVPYSGKVKGAVVSDPALGNANASAGVVSAQTGRGLQTFSELTMDVWEEGGLSYLATRGIGVTACSNGDLIRIRFELLGVFTGPSTVTYVGDFEVLSGGTGRFAYEDITGPLGSGLIEGNATLLTDATTGALTFAFWHRFEGTLLAVGGNRAGR